MVTPYKSVPIYDSKVLDIRIAKSSKALPANMRKLKQRANMTAVFVLRLLFVSMLLYISTFNRRSLGTNMRNTFTSSV